MCNLIGTPVQGLCFGMPQGQGKSTGRVDQAEVAEGSRKVAEQFIGRDASHRSAQTDLPRSQFLGHTGHRVATPGERSPMSWPRSWLPNTHPSVTTNSPAGTPTAFPEPDFRRNRDDGLSKRGKHNQSITSDEVTNAMAQQLAGDPRSPVGTLLMDP